MGESEVSMAATRRFSEWISAACRADLWHPATESPCFEGGPSALGGSGEAPTVGQVVAASRTARPATAVAWISFPRR